MYEVLVTYWVSWDNVWSTSNLLSTMRYWPSLSSVMLANSGWLRILFKMDSSWGLMDIWRSNFHWNSVRGVLGHSPVSGSSGSSIGSSPGATSEKPNFEKCVEYRITLSNTSSFCGGDKIESSEGHTETLSDNDVLSAQVLVSPYSSVDWIVVSLSVLSSLDDNLRRSRFLVGFPQLTSLSSITQEYGTCDGLRVPLRACLIQLRRSFWSLLEIPWKSTMSLNSNLLRGSLNLKLHVWKGYVHY